MFQITDEAKIQLQNKLEANRAKPYIRLQMRFSCFMKVKLTMDEAIQPNDEVVELKGFTFIIDKEHVHFFLNKKLDFKPDQTGYKQFEII